MQSACTMLRLMCPRLFANIANRPAIQGYSIECHSPAAFSTTKEGEKHAWGLIPGFLIESHAQWSPLSVCITWSGVILRSKESPLTTKDAIAIFSEYLNCLGTMRTWPPGVRKEELIAEPNPQGRPMHKTEWKYCAIAAAFNFVGHQNNSLTGDTSPVPLNLLPSAITPLSFQAKEECPTSNPEPGTVYVSPVSPAVILAESQTVAFRVSEELHICFDGELVLTVACKLTLILLQDEWPSAPQD